MLAPKFIVQDNKLIIGQAEFHVDLKIDDKIEVNGGGWWKLEPSSKTFTFYGTSMDFGKAKVEDIQACIKSGNVGNMSRHQHYKDYKFIYMLELN